MARPTGPFAAILLLSASMLAPAAAQAPAPAAPTRAITQITGDLYRFQNNFHYSVFYVTPEGVIATDPINADAARWLKDEIAKRFNRPVRYLVYSHDHADHISGGEVFADTAVVVAHENARRTIIAERRPTAVPAVTFTDRMTLVLGGRTVELSYVGRNHSDNSIVIRFPAERVAFAVDFIPVKSLAFRALPDSYWPDWIDSIRRVEQMDFDILAPGRGPLGSKADAVASREYLSDLWTEVVAVARAGRTLDDAKQSIKLAKYQGWGQYEQFLPLNIEGMWRHVANQRVPNP